MGTGAIEVHHPFSVHDRLRRLGWLGLWLLAQRSLDVWLTVPSTRAATRRCHG